MRRPVNMPDPGPLVIGLGNRCRGDDAAGLLAARALAARALPGVRVAEAGGEGAQLMERWAGAGEVYLIDAVRALARPGRTHRIDAARRPLPAGLFRCSSHAFGLAEAVELARALHRLPATLVVYGIEGVRFELGQEVSPAVMAGVEAVVAALEAELRGGRPAPAAGRAPARCAARAARGSGNPPRDLGWTPARGNGGGGRGRSG